MEPLASFEFQSSDLAAALEFLKRTRNELRMLRKVRVWVDHFRVYDVNGDCFEVRGIGYPEENIRPLLDAVHTAYNPESLQEPPSGPYKEFKTGKRRPWAEDRVM
jgi:hypothetical protein